MGATTTTGKEICVPCSHEERQAGDLTLLHGGTLHMRKQMLLAVFVTWWAYLKTSRQVYPHSWPSFATRFSRPAGLFPRSFQQRRCARQQFLSTLTVLALDFVWAPTDSVQSNWFLMQHQCKTMWHVITKSLYHLSPCAGNCHFPCPISHTCFIALFIFLRARNIRSFILGVLDSHWILQELQHHRLRELAW